MKRYVNRILLAVALVALPLTPALTCKPSQVTATYNTLYSVEHSVVSANDAYQQLVIKGSLPTNSLPLVSARYNQFQAAFMVALDAAQFNTNALAPASLSQEANDVISLITAIKNGGVK